MITENIRITPLTESLVRFEYSPNGVFNDYPTLFAGKTKTTEGKYSFNNNNGAFVFDCGLIKLTCTDSKNPPAPDTLYAEIGDFKWKYGDKNTKNLGGTLSTLDGVSGWRSVDEGLLSRNGWYIIDDSAKPIIRDEWIEKSPYPDNIDIYIFGYGTNYKSALFSLAYISGKAELPRKYTFGSWYSRWWPYNEQELRDIVKEYKEHNFPLDIMVIDMDWHYNDWQLHEDEEINKKVRATRGYGHADNLGWTGYTWNNRLIPDPSKLLKDFHDDKIYVTLNDHPADGIRTNEELYADFMLAMGVPPNSEINLEYDISDKKYVNTLFNTVHSKLENDGVDFWWVDWQQDYIKPFVKGIKGLRHLPWLNYLYYNHMKRDGMRGISFSRWGGWGDQKHPIYFSGDTKSTWEMLAFEVWFTATSGNALCFYWGHDTGGFYGDRDAEMYVRWTQFTAFSTSLRVHSQRDPLLDRRPWMWGEMAENAMRDMYHLRSRLIPYIYSTAYQAYEKDIPVIRPMYLEYPEVEAAYEYKGQYMFGDAFICAPITSAGEGEKCVSTHRVWVPNGKYYNFFTNEEYAPNSEVEITCDINTFPLLIKGGVPVPMQNYSDRMTSAECDELTILCYPGDEGNFTLYEDDGMSEGYKNGEHLKTEISYENNGDNAVMTITPNGKYDKMPKLRGYTLKFPCTCRKFTVKANVPVSTEYKNDVNTVRIEKIDTLTSIRIEFS